ncbi:MAG: MBOAT family O-acyltransferase, partial [Gammaproteobacteria bacterium]
FNSYIFIFAFLPLTLLGFFGIARLAGQSGALAWLVGASLVFYAAWNPAYVGFPLFSVAFNFIAGKMLLASPGGPRRKWTLVTALLVNILTLGFFKLKVSGFFSGQGALSAAFSTREDILIPLAISFITFQQIAYLVDIYKRRIKQCDFLSYCLFITFFPQLIMGPIVHYREILPQFAKARIFGPNRENLAVGLSLFAVGLFKKVVLADSIAPFVNHVYDMAGGGRPIAMADAWAAVVGFQFQIYFDFSGYADMAVGLAKMFNINLPINFDSPFRAVDRFDVWRRWHVSFSTFMRQYVFFPLVRSRPFRSAPNLALLSTTLISGFWHGLGWTFLLWGAAQGLLMLMLHYWRAIKKYFKIELQSPLFIAVPATFTVTLMLSVLFRSKDMAIAGTLYSSLLGTHGAGLNELGKQECLILIVMGLIVWGVPNSRQFFGRYWSAIDQRSNVPVSTAPSILPWISDRRFALNRRWAFFIAFLLAASFHFLDGSVRFIYYQF